MISNFKVRFHTSIFEDPSFSGGFGSLINDQPIIYREQCWPKLFNYDIMIFGSSNKTIKLLERRQEAACIVLNQNKMWITGGNTWITGGSTNTTEFISLDERPTKGPNLPFQISNHCMIQVNSKTIYIIGKPNEVAFANMTWIVDLNNNFEIKEGPFLDLLYHEKPTAAKMYLNGKIFIVVCGCNGETKLLDTSAPRLRWENGKHLSNLDKQN